VKPWLHRRCAGTRAADRTPTRKFRRRDACWQTGGLEKFGRERAVWAVLLLIFMVGLRLFEVGVIVLMPVIWSLTKESKKSFCSFVWPCHCRDRAHE